MANPQKENGHTDIANEVLDALAHIRIPGEARQILDCIIRKTWGWHKKSDHIALSQFVDGTGLHKSNICRALRTLLSMNLVIRNDNGIIRNDNGMSVSYCFNKDYETWIPLPKQKPRGNALSETIMSVIRNDNASLSETIPTKTTTTKTTLTKEKNFLSDSIEIGLSNLLLEEICKRKLDFKKPNLQAWGKHIDRMVRLDRRAPERIRAVILWCQADEFWQNNVLSTEKLRKQFDKLELKMEKTDERAGISKGERQSQTQAGSCAQGARKRISEQDWGVLIDPETGEITNSVSAMPGDGR